MDDVTKPLDDAANNIQDQVGAAHDKLAEVPDAVAKLTESGITKVEDALNNFDQKQDAIFGAIDNFFKKF